MNISQRFKLIRTLRRLTQKKLGNEMGVGKTTISDIETGNVEPSADLLAKAARALGVSLAELTGEIGSNRDTRIPIDVIVISEDVAIVDAGPLECENGQIIPARQFILGEREIEYMATTTGRRILFDRLGRLYRASFDERIASSEPATWDAA